MDQSTSVIIFSVVLIAVVAGVIIIYNKLEKKKKKSITSSFRAFSETYKTNRQNMRAMPRMILPEQLDVILTLTDDKYFGLVARATDISLTGFSVRPDFPLKKLPLKASIKNVLVVTPINTFAVKEMNSVRIDHYLDKRLLAFHIRKIDDDQLENMKQFMTYLHEFMKSREAEESQ